MSANAIPLRNATGNFTRPNDTNVYASGDLVANSVTAGSVLAIALQVTRSREGSFSIPRVRLSKSGTTPTNASFRVHMFRSTSKTDTGPAVTNGDNGAFVPAIANYLGYADLTMIGGTDGCAGQGVPLAGASLPCEILVRMSADTRIFVLIEARGAYTPIANEVFTVTVELEPAS